MTIDDTEIYSPGEQPSAIRVARLTDMPRVASEAFLSQLPSFLPSPLFLWSYFASNENMFSLPCVAAITAVHQTPPALRLQVQDGMAPPVPWLGTELTGPALDGERKCSVRFSIRASEVSFWHSNEPHGSWQLPHHPGFLSGHCVWWSLSASDGVVMWAENKPVLFSDRDWGIILLLWHNLVNPAGHNACHILIPSGFLWHRNWLCSLAEVVSC